MRRIVSSLSIHTRWVISALIVLVPLMLVVAAAVVGAVHIANRAFETTSPSLLIVAWACGFIVTVAMSILYRVFADVCVKYDHLKTEHKRLAQGAAAPSTARQPISAADAQQGPTQVGDNQMTIDTTDPEELCQCDNCVLARTEAKKIVNHISAFSRSLGDNEHKDAVMERVLVETAHYALQHYVGMTIYNAYISDTDPQEAADDIHDMLALILKESHKDGVQHAKDALIADNQAAEDDPSTHTGPARRDQ